MSEHDVRKIAEAIIDDARKGACGACGSIINESVLAYNIAAALRAERARVIRLPHTHGDVILAATPDGREFVCAMEVDRLLKESEDRVLSDLAFRLGIDIERLPGTDGITCDSGGGGYDGARPVPMYASLEVRRLRKQAAEAAKEKKIGGGA